MDVSTKKAISNLNDTFDKRFDDLDKKFDKRFDDLATIISDFATSVDQRFTNLEVKVDAMQKDVQNIINRLDSIENDIQLNDQERAVMGMQLTRLHDWVEKAALKVGVEFTH